MNLTITSDGYSPATLIVNFAKPLPPPLSPPAQLPVGDVVPQIAAPVVNIPTAPPSEPLPVASAVDTLPVVTTQAVAVEVAAEAAAAAPPSQDSPQVLAAESQKEPNLSLIDLILLWLRQIISGKIWL